MAAHRFASSWCGGSICTAALVALVAVHTASAQETLISVVARSSRGRLEIHRILDEVAVYLPPGHGESDHRYPVAYLWMQRGRESLSAGFSPRPLLDLLHALNLPYVYVETEDNHQARRDNNTDDFLAFFHDQMQPASHEDDQAPPPGRVTEHFVAVPGSTLDVEVDLRGAPDYAGASLRLDLSALGMEPAVLEHGGSGRYTYALHLPDPLRNAAYILPVCRHGGARDPEHVYAIRVSVLPREDAVLFGEALASGWQLEPTSRLTVRPEVRDGRPILALSGSGSWTLSWVAADPAPLFG